MEVINRRKTFILLSLLFFLLGFLTVLVDSLIPRLRELFTLSYFQSGLVQFAFFMAYFILSIPSGFVISKLGYKKGVVIGLLAMTLGTFLFSPAAIYRSYALFMLAYFIIAAGMTILQTAINPYVAAIGSEESSSSRLTLAQAFNSLGTTIAPAVGALFILSDRIKTTEEISALTNGLRQSYLEAEAMAVQKPFLWISLVLLMISLGTLFTKLPNLLQEKKEGSYWDAWKHRNLWMGVIGIFCYVGSEVTIGSYLVNYFLSLDFDNLILESSSLQWIAETLLNGNLLDRDPKAIVGVFVTFYWTGAMIGRFIGSYLNKLISPAILISIFASAAISMILISINTNGILSMVSILCVGLFNSIMFPTIFSISLMGLGELKPKASGLLCMAIVGGAILPPAFGFLVDQSSFQTAFLLLLLTYGYIGIFGWVNKGLTSIRS